MSDFETDIYEELYAYTEIPPVINTHSHHRVENHQNYNLDTLLRASYVNWCGATFGDTAESRRSFLEKVRFNSYFIWLEKALQKLHGFNGPVTEENWDTLSNSIKNANSSSNYPMELLKRQCGYEKIILDAYWNPGWNPPSGLFAPTFRIDMFLNGYRPDFVNRNGSKAGTYLGSKAKDIDEYTARLREVIANKKNEGCVALKCAIAYERDLNFNEVSKEKAQVAMTTAEDQLTQEDRKAFGDYVFYKICGIAAELDIPVQCHVGLGILKNTNAMQMQEVIHKNPLTRFVLFHGGYPWLDDVVGLAHNYPNVYPDICWLPLISTSAAERMLIELIEVSSAAKICWGCDTWTAEESVGALLALRHVLAAALSKKVCEGYFTAASAKKIIENILYKNPKEIYKL